MTNDYLVKVTEQARGQLREIAQYIANELKNPDAALHTLDVLEESISSLSQFPQRVSLTEEEPWRSLGIHKLPLKNFLVYFLVDEKDLKVQVTAIVYNKRDQKMQLSQMSWE